MSRKKRSIKNNKISEKQASTLKDMKKTREEDSIRLRKKVEQLIQQAEQDRKNILEIRKTREEQLQTLNIQLLKNKGAIEILQILLGNNNG